MLLELLTNYPLVLSLIKLQNVTGTKIKQVLNLAGINLSEEISNIIAELLVEANSEMGIKSLADIGKNEQLMTQISGLISQFAGSQQSPEQKLTLTIDTVTNCPHCSGAFALRDAPGIKKYMLENNLK